MKYLVLLVFLAGCTSSRYIADHELCLAPKEAAEIKILNAPPKRAVVRLGVLSVNGNGWASESTCIKAAKKKAADLGGDFLVIEAEGVEHETVYVPGTASASTSLYGSSATTTEGYTYDVSKPWGKFSVWAYAPADLGVKFDGTTITGFKLGSDAESSDLKRGDQIVGIDSLDVDDPRLIAHMMELEPGDSVCMHIRRGEDRLDLPIRTTSN